MWGLAERGFEAHIAAGVDEPMLDARCESCGACVAYCPTGALDNKLSMNLGVPDKKVMTTCTYCGVGCQFDLNVKDNKIIRVTSNPKAPVNGMHLCVKGRYGYDFVHHPDRLTKPLVRKYLLEGRPGRRTTADQLRSMIIRQRSAVAANGLKLTGIPPSTSPRKKLARSPRYLRRGFGRRAGLGQVPERRKLLDEQICAAGHRHQRHRPLRPSLTQQHCRRSGGILRFGRDDQSV